MVFKEREIKGVYEIESTPFVDERGFFMRTYDSNFFKAKNINTNWVQENHSLNLSKNTIRGLHFIRNPHTDGKLIRCIKGRVYDVFVDLRKNSPTFGKWDHVTLDEKKHQLLYLPKGMAHGFCTLTNNTEILYKHDTFYHSEFDSGIKWDDNDLDIKWPTTNPIISEKDENLMTFEKFKKIYIAL